MLEKLTIDMRHWYARGNPFCDQVARDAGYDRWLSRLRDHSDEGNYCCLGFYCLQSGLKDDDIAGDATPADVEVGAPHELLDGPPHAAGCSPFADHAMALNDAAGIYADTGFEERCRLLQDHFEKHGSRINFTLDGHPWQPNQTS